MSVSTRLSFIAALLLLVISAAAVQAQPARCRPCEIAQERCSVNCLGRQGKAIGACLIQCDNAAAVCSCDEPATLNSEDFVARFGQQPGPQAGSEAGLKVVTAFAAACHSTTPCGSAYGACANYSSYSDCGDPVCGLVMGCGACDEWGHCQAAGQGMKQLRERYRVCFNELGQSCTEYQRTQTSLGCGC
jgi:hypothetical protein